MNPWVKKGNKIETNWCKNSPLFPFGFVYFQKKQKEESQAMVILLWVNETRALLISSLSRKKISKKVPSNMYVGMIFENFRFQLILALEA